MRVLCESHPAFAAHDAGPGHPEHPDRLGAALAGLDAVRRLRDGDAEAAFCVVRPPGHHATPSQAMGFCLFNNLAVCAAILAAEGERVVIVDWDAHHGNGTQDAFWNDPRVLYVSMHQWPLYPGTGRLTETGEVVAAAAGLRA